VLIHYLDRFLAEYESRFEFSYITNIISDSALAIIGNMGSHLGDELQIIHPLDLFVLFPTRVADLTYLFIQGEAIQGQQRPDHIFFHAFGL